MSQLSVISFSKNGSFHMSNQNKFSGKFQLDPLESSSYLAQMLYPQPNGKIQNFRSIGRLVFSLEPFENREGGLFFHQN